MKISDNITAIILAGGQSSRMGSDKALIKFDNQPLLQKICLITKTCVGKVYVVTPWTERYQDIVPSPCFLLKENQSLGPLVAFVQALAVVKTEWVLLLACDLPLLNELAIKKWCDYLWEVPNEAIATLPKSDKGWEPLCGFYRSSCLPLLEDFINTGGRSFQQWLAQYPVQELPIRDRRVLFNCNTPLDMEKIAKCFNPN